MEIGKRYDIHFIEIGTENDHVHFLIQSIPMIPVTKIVTTIKSITARHVFNQMPELKKALWGASLWSSGYYASTVGKHSNEDVISKYVRAQGISKEYQLLHRAQLKLF